VARADDDDGFVGRFDHSDDLLRVVVPDDLRELDEEVTAYRREQEAARRRERRRRRLHRFIPRWARGGLPSPVFTAVLLVIATTGLLLSVFAPVTREAQHQLPVTSLARPTIADGLPGGLLPEATLVADNNRLSSRSIRPAIFAIMPANCDCASLVRQIVGQANEQKPSIYVVLVSARKDTTAARLADASDAGNRWPVGVNDVTGKLAAQFQASDTVPTVLLVRADGTLATKPIVFHDGSHLESALTPLRT
jgi:hypothetical protein